MGSTRRRFTDEYKTEAVQYVVSSGRPVAEVARNLGIVEATLGRWVAKARENGEAKEPELDVSEPVREPGCAVCLGGPGFNGVAG